MSVKRKILFLGETFRADAQTWMNGLREFGDFEIVTWEMKENKKGWRRLLRLLEFLLLAKKGVRKVVLAEKPDMVIAERTTSFGYLAAVSGVHPIAVAQQGITDIFPANSVLVPLKKWLQNVAFRHADIIHAWGPVMVSNMRAMKVPMDKVMVMPKGIDLRRFTYTPPSFQRLKGIKAIVTRSLMPEYRHDIILEAAALLHQRGIRLEWVFVGDGMLMQPLKKQASSLNISHLIDFKGRIPNHELPQLLTDAVLYVSVPVSEGVSSSLFEAMASGCFPIVTDLPGNRSWITHGENGFLVPVGHAQKLADALEKAIDHLPDYFDAISRNRAFVEDRANFEKNMKVISSKYHQLIDKTRESGSGAGAP